MSPSKTKSRYQGESSTSQSSNPQSIAWPLPTELSFQILSYLSYHDTRSFSLTSRSIYTLCRSTGLHDIIRIGFSRDDYFKRPKFISSNSTILPHKADRFVDHMCPSDPRPLYQDVLQVQEYAIGPLIREALLGIGHYDADIDALRQFLHEAPNIKSLHVFGLASPNAPLALSTAMTSIRTTTPQSQLDNLVFHWRWEGDYSGTILDASTDGPAGLEKLKMDLRCKAKSRQPIPRNLLPRIIKRAAINSINTITELELRYHQDQEQGGGPIRGNEIDLRDFAGMPLKILRYKTWPQNVTDDGPEKSNLCKICNTFLNLEELLLDEQRPTFAWKDENIKYLAKLSKCKKLTLSHCFPYSLVGFNNWDYYDFFVSILPPDGTSEGCARQLLQRTDVTEKLAEAMRSLGRITWLDSALVGVGDSMTRGRYVAAIVKFTEREGKRVAREELEEEGPEVIKTARVKWEWQRWWDSVQVTQLGWDTPSQGRENLADVWRSVTEDGLKSRSAVTRAEAH